MAPGARRGTGTGSDPVGVRRATSRPTTGSSVFGGPAWTRITEPDGQPGPWYLHLFAPEQPDLDWTRTEVRDGFDSILAFWLDRGVDGFRIDVAHGLAKDPELADIAGRFAHAGVAAEGHPHWDRDEVHDIYRGWRRLIDTYPGDRIFVAEAYLGSARRLARYVRPDELHTAFNFDLLLAPWDATALTDAIDESITGLAEVGATPTWVLSNHDMVRHVTRYGGGDLGRRRARAAILLLLALPGAAYLYQGEELGLPEVTDLPDDALQDPTFLRSGGRGTGPGRLPGPVAVGRRRAVLRVRTRPGGVASPTGRLGGVDRERQAADPDSMLALYRSALALRRDLPSLGAGPFAWVGGPAGGHRLPPRPGLHLRGQRRRRRRAPRRDRPDRAGQWPPRV